jgi:LPXTG-site transpeptidase (sortase) family protein
LARKWHPERLRALLRRESLGAVLVGTLVFAVVALVLAWALAPEQLPPQPQLSTSLTPVEPATEVPRPSARDGHLGSVPRATAPRDPAKASPPSATQAAVSSTERIRPERLLISAIGVDAPLTRRGVDGDGAMQLPNGPEDVAWYEFTGSPSEGSNVVLSGHLDYRGYGPAVFYRLRELNTGDIVELRTVDGSLHRYAVSASVTYDGAGAPVSDIIGPTSREVVTLITCGGTFNGPPLGYSHRLVVRAEHL